MRMFPQLFTAGCLLLAACQPESATRPVGGGRLYASLAAPGAAIDTPALASLLNDYRKSVGLRPVAIDPALMRFAETQVAAITGRDTLAIPGGQPLKARLSSAGLKAGAALENVSAGYYTISDAFSGWRGSKPNDATLRLASATRMGVATRAAPGSKYGVYWVLVMAGE